MKIPGNEKRKRKQKAVSVEVGKIRNAISDVLAQHKKDLDSESPVFSFRYLNQSNYEAASPEDKAALANTMNALGRVTWKEIHTLHRHKLGFETIPRKDLAFPIPAQLGSDTRFMAFRFNGMKPMVGFREGGIFHILWLDMKYAAYGHG